LAKVAHVEKVRYGGKISYWKDFILNRFDAVPMGKLG
jgi:hypothetical protein